MDVENEEIEVIKPDKDSVELLKEIVRQYGLIISALVEPGFVIRRGKKD